MKDKTRQSGLVNPLAPAEAFVLAGGRSTRMGRDKALLSLGGRALIDLALEKLRAVPLADGAIPRIAGSRPDLTSHAPIVEDLHPGCGPLSGIEAALSATQHELNLFLPVDLPLLPSGFLTWMLRRAWLTGALVTSARVQGKEQPLCAIYHPALLPSITESLNRGDYKVRRAIENALQEQAKGSGSMGLKDVFDLEIVLASYPELHRLSPIPWYRWFQNCNSPEDLEKAAS